ncbi:ATP-binding protein [Paucibacter sp. R3-3]|uniref:histidine kinase n=1 Tax=Roseateles agri TaxID=3098619 RepID=A0ABU5DC96_9BURK|nr:ATP-binding protein [Paucibacter sp. R3-3]MDY0743916.1 ATP-binding protein [Paucibacter sp. R3-3]
MKFPDLSRGLGRIVWLANLLFALGLLAALWMSHAQQLEHAHERADSTAVALGGTVGGVIDQIDLLLDAAVDELEQELGEKSGQVERGRINATIERLLRDVPGLDAVRFSDAAGRVREGDGLPRGTPATSIADREYFQQLREHNDTALVTSRPLPGRSAGRQVLVFAHSYRDATGRFAGVVYASIELSRFSTLFGGLQLGPNSTISLVSDGDFLMLARYPAEPVASVIGQSLPRGGLVELMKGGQSAVTMTFESRFDNIERLFALRKLPSHPYWIAVGLSTHDELRPWRQQLALAALVMALFAGATGIAGWQLGRGSREQLRTLAILHSTLEATDNGILVLDQQRRMLHANQRFAKLWNLPEAMIVPGASDQTLLERVLEQLSDPAQFLQDVEAAYADPRGYARVTALRFKDGRVLERTAHPMRVGGRAAGLVWSFRDVTERIQREQELANHRDELERRVEERTHELAIAKELAESSNRAKSAFLSKMSHELRTPLNAILGFVQLLQFYRQMSEESQRRLATIDRAGRHLLGLINEVLELSRIEAGRSVLQVESFDLAELVDGVAELIRGRADSKGLAFEVERAAGLPAYVSGDGARLRQVLINLLGNAVKYTLQGRVELRVRVGMGDEIVFEIADTGPGIAAEDQEKIFQAFFQTDGAMAKGEGTGLGLTISQEYARLMGGALALFSEPPDGCVFTLRVPLPVVRSGAAPRVARPGRVRALAPGQVKPRVLVVDDRSDNRELVQQMLERVGIETRTANDGQQAVRMFQAWQPALICMDIRMPVMDGYAATRAIRALPGGREVRIAALTASAFEEDRQAILDAGCDEMLRKPLQDEQLFALMTRLLGLLWLRTEEDPLPLPP